MILIIIKSFFQSGSWVITLADYQGKTADKHLSFQKGELILVREQKDATWYSGQMNDKVKFLTIIIYYKITYFLFILGWLVSKKSCSNSN